MKGASRDVKGHQGASYLKIFVFREATLVVLVVECWAAPEVPLGDSPAVVSWDRMGRVPAAGRGWDAGAPTHTGPASDAGQVMPGRCRHGCVGDHHFTSRRVPLTLMTCLPALACHLMTVTVVILGQPLVWPERRTRPGLGSQCLGLGFFFFLFRRL